MVSKLKLSTILYFIILSILDITIQQGSTHQNLVHHNQSVYDRNFYTSLLSREDRGGREEGIGAYGGKQ